MLTRGEQAVQVTKEQRVCFFSSEGEPTFENCTLVTAVVSKDVLVHELPGLGLGGLQLNPGAAELFIILQNTPGS